MITKLLELTKKLLKDRMDEMSNNYERSEWLKGLIEPLPETLKSVIIAWFLEEYRDK